MTVPALLDVRAFVAIADADELLARPALLAAFASAFGPDADATLVLAARDVQAVHARFSATAVAAGLDEPDVPDVLALEVGALADAPAQLARHAHAILSEHSHGDPWTGVPRCSVGDHARLRELAQLHADLGRIRSSSPANLALPAGYEHRLAPEYFDDARRADADVVHQPDVYGAAAALARRFGATHIIDIGCGAAEKLLALAPEFHLVGLDFGENLAHCRARHPEHTWLSWDIEREPLPALPASLLRQSVVVCADVIEHLVDPAGLLRGMQMLDREVQAILLSTPDRARVRGPEDLGPPANTAHVREWTLDELLTLLSAADLAPAFAGYTVNNDRDRLKRTSIAIVDRRRGAPIEAAPADFKVTAVVPAFNEADVIEHTVRRLLDQGMRVHVVDNWSTDETVARVESIGLSERLRVERFPADGPSATYDWAALLRNTERIARELGDGWVIHQDADEIRESPWPGVNLRDALYHVQRCGYNAVDHTVIDFVPTDDAFVDGGDVEQHMRHFRFGERPGHFVQIKAWRTGAADADLTSSGGHDVQFAGRRIYPYKFLTKHYPIRSQAHGLRKVFADRIARWNAQERAIGWHNHYEGIDRDHTFVRPAGELLRHGDDFHLAYVVERLTGVGIVLP